MIRRAFVDVDARNLAAYQRLTERAGRDWQAELAAVRFTGGSIAEHVALAVAAHHVGLVYEAGDDRDPIRDRAISTGNQRALGALATSTLIDWVEDALQDELPIGWWWHRHLCEHIDPAVRAAHVVSATPMQTWRLARDADPAVRERVARWAPVASRRILSVAERCACRILLHDPEPRVRARLAERADERPMFGRHLVHDRDPRVRRVVAGRSRDASVLARLARDADPDVAEAARGRATKLRILLPDGLNRGRA